MKKLKKFFDEKDKFYENLLITLESIKKLEEKEILAEKREYNVYSNKRDIFVKVRKRKARKVKPLTVVPPASEPINLELLNRKLNFHKKRVWKQDA